MRIAVTGATGRVGFPILRGLMERGHEVVVLGRRPVAGVAHLPWRLDGDLPDLGGCDALVHAAFAHVPGRYRGGEGDDPEGFRALNRDGTRRLFAHARAQGVGRVAFLSSRAVYDGYPSGTALPDGLPARPESLYGHVKAEVEAWLAEATDATFAGISLRATGVYGAGAPGQPHKWADLFADRMAGAPPVPRIGTEVHEDDLAAAVALVLTAETLPGLTFNVSDILLDHRDLLAVHDDLTGVARPLPPRSDPGGVSAMTCERLRALGWQPRGPAGLRPAVAALLA